MTGYLHYVTLIIEVLVIDRSLAYESEKELCKVCVVNSDGRVYY